MEKIEELTSGTHGERITTEKFRIVCRGDGGPESERYGVIGHQLPDGRFLTVATGEGQRDDLWPSRDDYAPNGLDTIESITSEGVSSIDGSVVGNADVES